MRNWSASSSCSPESTSLEEASVAWLYASGHSISSATPTAETALAAAMTIAAMPVSNLRAFFMFFSPFENHNCYFDDTVQAFSFLFSTILSKNPLIHAPFALCIDNYTSMSPKEE